MPIPANLHLEIQSHRSNHYGLIRSSFRANGKVKHTNHGRISGLPLDKLKLIQAAFRGDVVAKNSAGSNVFARSSVTSATSFPRNFPAGLDGCDASGPKRRHASETTEKCSPQHAMNTI